jgi:aspartate aminotransferase-like enzyme
MAGPIVYHRGPDFPALLTGVVDDLKRLFPTEHEIFVLSTSGTGAMEAAVVNTLSAGDTVIVARAGNFGARWDKICIAYGIEVIPIEAPWGRAIQPDAVADALKAHPNARAVLTTHSETSTGVLHDIEAIGHVVAETDALFIVDGISSVCAHALPTDDWHIDVAVTASQKGLMVPPGFAVIAFGPKAREASANSTLPKHYLDLTLYRESLEEGRGPFTLPVTLLVGARAALDIVSEEGIENIWSRHARQAEASRSATTALGLDLFAERPSNVLTAIALPNTVDGLDLMQRLREQHGIIVGGGLVHLRGKLIRLSNLGYVKDKDLLAGIDAIEQVLTEMDVAIDRGSGTGAAESVLGS